MASAERRRLIPFWVIYTAAGLILAIAATAGVVLWRGRASLVTVPSVAGLDVAIARSRLGEQGLLLAKGDLRFSSTIPRDGVLQQNPPAGAQVPQGTTVIVVLSAGSGSFALPDVTAMPLSQARAVLQDKGLVVRTEVVASSQPKNLVVSMLPAPGVIVSVSDIVKLSVSSGGSGVGAVNPVDLTGKVFVIDPVPVSSGTTDPAMEVEFRLQSFLEASGATVTVTRTITDTQTTTDLRAQRVAAEASVTAIISLQARATGPAGFGLLSLASTATEPARYLGSQELVKALTTQFTKIGGSKASEIATDPVLGITTAPGVRIVLGSFSQERDAESFADPAWADNVAAAVYGAISSAQGGK
jgi:beta-lactam-binding protein with PASTA domain